MRLLILSLVSLLFAFSCSVSNSRVDEVIIYNSELSISNITKVDNRVSKPPLVWSSKEVECLALNIYHEARGSSYEDQLGVAGVTMHRVLSNRWPDTVCEVVYQKSQFSWTIDNLSDVPYERDVYEDIYLIAFDVLVKDRFRELNLAKNHYYNPSIVKPRWHRAEGTLVGSHYYMSL